jgi:glycosyltransferase involved in cell wall biosynthesis
LPDDEFSDLVNKPIDYDIVIVHLIPEYFEPWMKREAGKTVIGLTVTETTKLLPRWPDVFNRLDGLIVPCQWNRDVFQAGGVTRPIAVVPHVGHKPPGVSPLSIPGVEPGDFVFYTIAAWRERNAPHLTLQSYLSAFTGEENVVLVIKTGHVNEKRWNRGCWWYRVMRHIHTSKRDSRTIRKRSGSSARVVMITDSLSAADIDKLHSRGDCYVSMTRAEGWSLGAYEAAFAGKPVIITGYGGQLDYLPPSLSYHVDYQLVPYFEPQAREMAWAPGAQWAEPDLAQGARIMREVFSQPEQSRKRGAGLQHFVQENFREDKIIDGMVKFLHSVSSGS